MFSIDGNDWNIPCEISRTAELTASEISGMLLDKTYFNDVLGTFMKYDIKIVVPHGKEGLYSQIYEILTDPVDAHTFVLPYNQDTVTITGRVETVSDKYYRKVGDLTIWRGTQFTVIANHPTKTYTLGEAVERGLSPFPDIVQPVEDGSLWQFTTANGWETYVPTEYTDGDEVAW